ncbi:MAG TPA: cation diffusion facilitator family transporter [Methanomassiliicoccales archaeon]|nr:cation diffusion facilitator family transporter [Methanomassiliicoccales archaeon]
MLKPEMSSMWDQDDREMGEMSNADALLRKGERGAMVSSWVTGLLALGKGAGGLLTGSLVLITDAVHSAIDVLPITASWLGLRVSRRKADERFPYGYYKAESIATLFISLFIIYAAIELVLEGYSRLLERSEVSNPLLAGGVALISSAVSALLAKYQRKVGEEIGSQSLIINSRDTFMDVFVSLLVVAAIALAYFEVPYVEGGAIIVISIIILKIGLESIKDAVFTLMDISPSREIEDRVIGTISGIAGVEGFADLKLRRSGPFLFGEVAVKVRKHLDVERAHEIAGRLEMDVRKNIGRLERFTVHIEPCDVSEVRVVVPLNNDGGLDSIPSDKFGRAPYFALVSVNKKERRLEEWTIIANDEKDREHRAGLHAVNTIVREKVDALITPEIGEISFHALRDQLVTVYRLEGARLEEVLEHYLNEELENILEPVRVDEQ